MQLYFKSNRGRNVGLSYMTFVRLNYVPSICTLLRVFNCERMLNFGLMVFTMATKCVGIQIWKVKIQIFNNLDFNIEHLHILRSKYNL